MRARQELGGSQLPHEAVSHAAVNKFRDFGRILKGKRGWESPVVFRYFSGRFPDGGGVPAGAQLRKKEAVARPKTYEPKH